jgi:mRNA interferase RelE/StbE
MDVLYTKQFSKDIARIKDKRLKDKILSTIQEVKESKIFLEINQLKKIKKHKNTYRIKIGNYRIGIYISGNVVEFARFVHRKDIYRYFP